jgi:hypothetical protein
MYIYVEIVYFLSFLVPIDPLRRRAVFGRVVAESIHHAESEMELDLDTR